MLREAYADARATTAAAGAHTPPKPRPGRRAGAEVAAESAQLDVEIAEVHETAVAAGKRMVSPG